MNFKFEVVEVSRAVGCSRQRSKLEVKVQVQVQRGVEGPRHMLASASRKHEHVRRR